MAVKTPKPVVVRRVGGACLLAAAFMMTACSDDSSDSSSSTPDASAAAEEQPTGEEQSADEQAAGGEQAADQSSANAVVARWVTAIVQNRPEDACLVMGMALDDSAPPVPGTPETCQGDAPQAQAVVQQVDTLRASFTPETVADPPVVEVTGDPAADGAATFGGEQITVDGASLQSVVAANSTGFEAGDIDVEISATDIDGLWYVTDMGLTIG